MHTQVQKRATTQGSVLMVTLFVTALFGLFLFSYLYLARTQRVTVARAQAWNAALGLAEAGAEEALAQLNPGAPQPAIDRSTNGWGQPVGGLYGPMTRTLPAGSYSTSYTTDLMPIIYSTGYVTVPALSATLSRAIRVTTTNLPLFTAGLACRSNINFSGNGVYVDSFNSMDPNLSTNGRYDPAKTSTNGSVGSVFGLVNVGNGNIYGNLLLGPTASDNIGANGLVTGGIYHDFNVEFEDVVLPPTSWLSATPTNITIGGVTYQYVFTGSGGDYSISSLSGNVYVGTNAHVRLLIQKSSNPGSIRVAGTGSSAGALSIYMNGPTFNLSGSTTVDGGNATNLAYFGTANNIAVTLQANANFTGTIYAPEAKFKLGGGGSNPYNYVGSCFANSIIVNGHYSFHFDENLLGPVLFRGFVAASWQEL